MFAHRFASEIVSVMEGRSAVWDRRQNQHKLATAARANLNHPALNQRRSKHF
jgi:small subunit ribosomal protein S7